MQRPGSFFCRAFFVQNTLLFFFKTFEQPAFIDFCMVRFEEYLCVGLEKPGQTGCSFDGRRYEKS